MFHNIYALTSDTVSVNVNVSANNFEWDKLIRVAVYTFLGCVFILYLRANLSIAIVDMTSNRTVTVGNETYLKTAEFSWTPFEQGVIHSAFNYGYLFAPLGGMLATRYGGATVFGLGILITGCLTVFTPIFCRFNFVVFILTRGLEGVFEAFSVASIVVLFVHWAPSNERARMITISMVGGFFGNAFNYPISGYVAEKYGWEAIFYFSGGISIVWYLLWISFVTDYPADHKSINAEELASLQNANGSVIQKKITYPWKKIMKSKAVWAFFVHRFANSWTSVFGMLLLPMYFNGLFNMGITNVGILAGIPNFGTIIIQPIAAIMFDFIRNKQYLSSTWVHKVFTCGSYVFNGIVLFLVTKCENYIHALICFTLLRLGSSYAETSYYTLPADLSPHHSGLLSGIGTSFYSLGSLLSPTLLGCIVYKQSDQKLWNNYFMLLSAITFTAAVIFLIFGSGDLQHWDQDGVGAPEDSQEMAEREKSAAAK